MPFPDNSFDAVYAIEATVHAPSLAGVYTEIFRVLKPGGTFGVYEVSFSFPISYVPFFSFPLFSYPLLLFLFLLLLPKQPSTSTSTTIPGEEFGLHFVSGLHHGNRNSQANNIFPQWLMTSKYDPSNAHHRTIRLAIEQGDGIANMVRPSFLLSSSPSSSPNPTQPTPTIPSRLLTNQPPSPRSQSQRPSQPSQPPASPSPTPKTSPHVQTPHHGTTPSPATSDI